MVGRQAGRHTGRKAESEDKEEDTKKKKECNERRKGKLAKEEERDGRKD